MTTDNPAQQANLSTLRPLAYKKIQELSTTVSLYQSGDASGARALVNSDRGKALMDQIRAVVGQMQAEESTLEAQRVNAYQQSVRTATACVYLASLVAITGLLLLGYFILREMNLRERHARMTAQREQWFRVTLTSLGDGVIATDEQGRVTFVNPVAERLIGIANQHAAGKAIHQVFPIFHEYTLQPVENPVNKVLELGRVVGVVLVFRDAGKERKSQEIMRKSEKLAVAARLSATVAHEINNPLESVGNLVYLAKTAPDLPPEAFDHLALAEQELERVSHITRQTLGFYRESHVGDQIHIAALVDTVLKLYSNKLASKNITVERVFGDCLAINGRAGELKQVIANLISNAIDAVSVNGTVSVKVLCTEDNGSKSAHVIIEDDGPGIPPELREKIFEPFFTTRPTSARVSASGSSRRS